MLRAPTQTPPLSYLLDDLPARAAQVARHLGLTLRTLERYRAADQAPRAVMLALFWESRWGLSLADTTAFNAAAVARGLAGSLERENAMLRARIARLEALGSYGSANAPLYGTITNFGGIHELR